MTYIWEEDANKLTKEIRLFFLLLFSGILIFSVTGNFAAIWLAVNRKHRLFYKCCVISLAASDVLMAVSTCSYSISMFAHPWVNWTIGEFMCKLIPFLQILAVLSNSFTLSSIAMDRYQGVVNATHSRWNPTLLICVGIIISIWSLATVAAIPMFLEYCIEPIFVLSGDKQKNIISSYTLVNFCSVSSKHRMGIYMSLMFTLIFLPLLVTFLVLYGMIGSFIWMRRPITGGPVAANSRQMEVCRRSEGDEDDSRTGGATESTSATAGTTLTSLSASGAERTPRHAPHHHEATRASQNEKRKKKILKIIFALMLTFFVTRLPIWCFNIASTNNTMVDKKWWILQYFLSALSLMGTVMNPFLYGFLQEGMARNRRANLINNFNPCGGRRRAGNARPPAGPQRRLPVAKKTIPECICSDQRRSQARPWTIT